MIQRSVSMTSIKSQREQKLYEYVETTEQNKCNISEIH